MSVLDEQALTDESILRELAESEPDKRFPMEWSAAIRRLEGRGLVEICGCSDGDYVILTLRGSDFLERLI